MVSFFFTKLQGRNNTGRITVRHRGGGVRFKHPNFPANYSFLKFFKHYSLSSSNILRGKNDFYLTPIYSEYPNSSFSPSFYNFYLSQYSAKDLSVASTPLFSCTIGQYISSIELRPNYGPKLSRAAGSFSQILKKRGSKATIRLPSGEIRRISVLCNVAIVTNSRKSTPFSSKMARFSRTLSSNIRRAGFSRLVGVRPHVRGCAINPVDHPHGGRTGESRPSVSPWGQLTKGYRTRSKKINRQLVITSVQDIKNKLSR